MKPIYRMAIPKSVKKKRIKENFNISDFELSIEEMAAIATLDMKTSLFFDHCDPEIIKWRVSKIRYLSFPALFRIVNYENKKTWKQQTRSI